MRVRVSPRHCTVPGPWHGSVRRHVGQPPADPRPQRRAAGVPRRRQRLSPSGTPRRSGSAGGAGAGDYASVQPFCSSKVARSAMIERARSTRCQSV